MWIKASQTRRQIPSTSTAAFCGYEASIHASNFQWQNHKIIKRTIYINIYKPGVVDRQTYLKLVFTQTSVIIRGALPSGWRLEPLGVPTTQQQTARLRGKTHASGVPSAHASRVVLKVYLFVLLNELGWKTVYFDYSVDFPIVLLYCYATWHKNFLQD